MSELITGYLFDKEMKDAGFTSREISNQRLRDAAYRLLVRGRLYRFNDADEIEYGVSGPFNDDENRAAAQRTDAVTPYEILKAFRDAGMNLEPTPNALYTVRGQHAQLIEGVRTLLEAAQDDGVKS